MLIPCPYCLEYPASPRDNCVCDDPVCVAKQKEAREMEDRLAPFVDDLDGLRGYLRSMQ
jgi:hypothetical protein